ncbi:MAG TPA: methyltransferase domain-containing protein [Caulobacteraceae bacterium]|jgi:SAM-dependent methyltransferase|nr:methyltransferase domain-containing protein [Caulobacteraceae bacterium]
MTQPPPLFDRARHRARLDRAAAGFAGAEFLKRRAAEDIGARLAAINRRFDLAIELGARTGVFADVLATGPAAGKIDTLIQADLSGAMLARASGPRVVADEARLPFAEESADLIVSSLALHWVDDVVGALIQIRRTLKADGLFLGSLLGGGTLAELRASLTEAELELTGGAGPRISPVLDPYDGGALMQRAGFALPVIDVDTVRVRYDHPLKLIADLRAMGETGALAERPRPLSRAVLARASEIYAKRFGEPDGRIAATFEIVTLTGWTPHPDQQQPLSPGSARTRLADALGTRERPAGEKAG